jgi:hypothetical protein
MTKQRKRIDPINVLLEIVIDLMLIGMGAALYVHFLVYSFGPIGLSPIVVNFFGSLKTAVYVIAGIPFVIGVLSLLKTITRVIFRPTVPAKSK